MTIAGGLQGRDRPGGAARVLQAVWLRRHRDPHATAATRALGHEDGSLSNVGPMAQIMKRKVYKSITTYVYIYNYKLIV